MLNILQDLIQHLGYVLVGFFFRDGYLKGAKFCEYLISRSENYFLPVFHFVIW